jgi:SpoVK/Ycf46/Vps4 family AAA+-type ATPase
MRGPSAQIVELDEEEAEAEKPWRLLVLEDTGELLTPDAKSVIGQGLSRFLNVVDGLIGQGLRVLVLVTTNEPIRALHPAVARPGRAAANIEFEPLSSEEATSWLRAREVDAPAGGARTIASLYAQLEGRDPNAPASQVGFGDAG